MHLEHGREGLFAAAANWLGAPTARHNDVKTAKPVPQHAG
jgi:hypothetical protein